MRLFVGVELSADVRASAAAVAESLRERLKQARLHVEARWVAAENLHITLWFIGEVDDGRADAITQALSPPFPMAPFDVALDGCGAFPPSGVPRVFWLGLAAGADRMLDLYREIAARLAPLGFEPEKRPYSAHLTIARVKHTRRDSVSGIPRALGEMPARGGSCRVGSVTLFRSRLSPKGSTYEPLARVPLQP